MSGKKLRGWIWPIITALSLVGGLVYLLAVRPRQIVEAQMDELRRACTVVKSERLTPEGAAAHLRSMGKQAKLGGENEVFVRPLHVSWLQPGAYAILTFRERKLVHCKVYGAGPAF